MNPRRTRRALFLAVGLGSAGPLLAAHPQSQLDSPELVLDLATYSSSLVGGAALGKALSGDFDADGNVDLLCRRNDGAFLVVYMVGVLEDVVRVSGSGVLDVAVLPGPVGAKDSVLAIDGSGLSIWTPGSGLFPALSSSSFEIQVNDPSLVAVSEPDSGGTAYGWIVGDDGTEVTPFEWDVATGDATELTAFTLSSAASQIACFSAYGGAQVDLAVLTGSGASIVDVEGDILRAVSGQDQDSLIVRMPGGSSSPDFLACILKLSGSSTRRLYVASVAGCDPHVGLGTYDYAACTVADVNNDSAPDLVVSRRGQKDLVAMLNDGTIDHDSARFTNDASGYAIVDQGPQSSSGSGAVHAVDLEGDGDQDVVWTLDRAFPYDLDVHLLRNLDVCAPSLSLAVTEFTFISCGGEGGFTGGVVATIEFAHPSPVPSGADTIRVFKLVPTASGDAIFGDAFVIDDFALGAGPTQTLAIEFEDVEEGHAELRYFCVQLLDRSGTAVDRGWPILTLVVGPKFGIVESIVENAVWPEPVPCVPATVSGSLGDSDCDWDGGGDEDGGDTGGVPKPPPVQPPYGGGG